MKKYFLLCFSMFINYAVINAQTVNNVNPSLFLADGTNVTITTVFCTLSNNTNTTCLRIVSTGTPADHNMGPWCPDNISDDPEAGGIWLEGGQVYDVDGAFIQNMANLYNDNNWLMYDGNGDIYTTDTEQDCANAANPNVGPEYENYCVECLPSYVTDLTQTYLIPITPVELNTPIQFGGGGPPMPGGAPTVRGLAFNGVRYDAPAPTNAILNAYTLAPLDDAGGHINLNAGYHYHAATGQSTAIPQCDGHAPMIGYAIDGHAIYANVNEDGNEPTDLDASGGHTSITQHSCDSEYHYHIQNELYLGLYYILFPGDYQGTPNAIQ